MRFPAALALSLAAMPAAATVGEQHRVARQPSAALRSADHSTRLRITVWYPAKADAPTTPIDIPPDKPIFEIGSVAQNAPFADEARHPVVLLSHGYGGSERVMGWFGTALAEHGYVVIAVDHPGNNGVDPMTPAGSVLWWDRADDLKLALATVRADPALAPHLDPQRLGVAGFSIGGLTALVAGGARIDPAKMLAFCHDHPEDGTCRPQLELPLTIDQNKAALDDPVLAGERAKAGANHAIPGVRAVVAMAPVVQPLTQASLRSMRMPVAILAGRDDVTVPPRTQAEIAKALIPHASLAELPGVTHYSFLATCTDAGRAAVPVCAHAANQADAHRVAIETALALFGRTLR